MHTQQKDWYQEQVQAMSWIVRLRWIAVGGIVAAAATMSHLLTPYNLTAVMVIAAVVAGYNMLALLHSRAFQVRGHLVWPGELNLALNLQFALDISALAVVVHLTGGVESRLIPVYLVFVPAARRILHRRATFLQATFALALLGTVFWLEYAGRLPHNFLGPGPEPHLYTNRTYVLQTLTLQACFLYLGAYIADRMNSRLHRSLRAERRARHMALTDSLTGLYSRRHLYRVLEREIVRSQRHGRTLSVLMFDLDDFKKYNDRFGHLAGDKVLCHLADLIRIVIRESDSAFRYGGEEFTLILPETTGKAALVLAERLRQVVEDHAFVIQGNSDLGRITVSVGVATYPGDGCDVESLINAADMALLRAKHRKNRVCMFSPWKHLYSPHPVGANAMPVALQ